VASALKHGAHRTQSQVGFLSFLIPLTGSLGKAAGDDCGEPSREAPRERSGLVAGDGADDGDVPLDGALALENAREHRNPLLGKNVASRSS